MTEPLTTARATGSVADADALSPPAEGGGTGEPGSGSQIPDPNKSLVEANARYVQERDTAREELATATARIERLNRSEVERLAAGGLSHPADLFSLSGNEVSDYLTEAGEVDAEKVAADVAAVLAERPGLRKGSPAFDPSQGSGGSAPKAAPSWGNLLGQ